MNLCVERPAAPGAGSEDARLVTALGGDGTVLATRLMDNPLRPGWRLPPQWAGDTLVLWSGTLADRGLFDASPRTWMAPGRETLDALCAALAPRLRDAGVTVCFHPHARHVLSDVPSSARFLDEHADGPFGLALAPTSLLEPGMLGAVEDHLERIFAALGPRCRLLHLHDVEVVPDDNACTPVPLGRGRLPREPVRRLLRGHVAEGTPIVLLEREVEAQVEWLGGSE